MLCMFIDLNELKALIIDLDSFPQDDEPDWLEIDDRVELLFFGTKDKRRLDGIAHISERFNIYNGSPLSVIVKKKILVDMLSVLDVHSYEAALLSHSCENLNRIQQLPVATIEYSNDVMKYERVGQLSDFQISSIDELNTIIRDENCGYYSEVASLYGKGTRAAWQSANVVVVEQDHLGYKCTIVAGGRYFNTNDVRNPFHQLSQRILKNKRIETRQDAIFTAVYQTLLNYINNNVEKVDGITRIPPRPTHDDRFVEIVRSLSKPNSLYENCSKNLVCIKDYPSQKGLNESQRQANIAGAFKSSGDIYGKHIVLIDDIISTRSTVFEAVKTLYENGAGRVTVLVLAINQLTNNIRSHYFTPLSCTCGGKFRLRFNGRDNSAFFGCSGYPRCRNSLDYSAGIRRHNEENDVASIPDVFEVEDWEF